jgi:hypothetical protein
MHSEQHPAGHAPTRKGVRFAGGREQAAMIAYGQAESKRGRAPVGTAPGDYIPSGTLGMNSWSPG